MVSARSQGPTHEDLLLARNAIAKGIITQSQLEHCVALQKKSSPRKPLGAIMLEIGILTDDDLEILLADHPEFVPLAKGQSEEVPIKTLGVVQDTVSAAHEVLPTGTGEDVSGPMAEQDEAKVVALEELAGEAGSELFEGTKGELSIVQEKVSHEGVVFVGKEARVGEVGETYKGVKEKGITAEKEAVTVQAGVGGTGAWVSDKTAATRGEKKESRFGVMARERRSKGDPPIWKMVIPNLKERRPWDMRKLILIGAAVLGICIVILVGYLVLKPSLNEGRERPEETFGKLPGADLKKAGARKEAARAFKKALLLKGQERLDALNEVIELDGDLGPAYFERGVVRQALGDSEGALADFNRAIEKGWDSVNVRLARGSLLLDEGRVERAAEDFQKAIALDSSSEQAYYGIARCFMQMSHFHRAIDLFSKAIDLKPEFAAAWYGRGMALMRIGEYDNAIRDFNRCIDLKYNVALSYAQKGLAFFKKGDFETAILAYTEAISRSPSDAVLYNNRGMAYYSAKRFEDAIKDFSRALGINKAYGDAILNRGNSFLMLGDYAAARNDFWELLYTNEELAGVAYRGLARAYIMEGNIADALEHIRLALENRIGRDEIREDIFFESLRGHEEFEKLFE